MILSCSPTVTLMLERLTQPPSAEVSVLLCRPGTLLPSTTHCRKEGVRPGVVVVEMGMEVITSEVIVVMVVMGEVIVVMVVMGEVIVVMVVMGEVIVVMVVMGEVIVVMLMR